MTNRLVLAALLVLPGVAPAASWKVDPAHSAASFTVRHLMISNVKGEFGKPSGAVEFDRADPSKTKIDATIDIATLTTREPDRDKHLKSPDFFDIEKFPVMKFRSTSVHAAGSGKLKLTGDLTIHGVTKEVTFDVDGPTPEIKDPWGNSRIGATATTKVNRKDFGLIWNKALDGGGVMIGDEVTVTLDVELVQAK